ncbi:MAG: family 16 glycoside hydrolase [Planctomycetota bacterium]
MKKNRLPHLPSIRLTVVAGLLLTFSICASGNQFEPGVAVKVYQLEGELENVPRLASGQTPNFEQVYENLDFEGEKPWANEVPGLKVLEIAIGLKCPEPGRHEVRLVGDGALRFQVWGGVRGETTTQQSPGTIPTHVKWGGDNYVNMAISQLVVDDNASDLKLEWKLAGSDEWLTVPAGQFRTGADPTRVTSPGPKRLTNTRAPGDGNPVAGLHPSYSITTIRPPESRPSVGAMTFLDDGRLIVGTFRPIQRSNVALPDIDSKQPDKLYEVRGAAGDDAEAYELVPVAEGLYEPSGLCVVDGVLYVAQRKAITRLTDTDGDGFFETHHHVGQGWEGWNYHQFTFGLEHRDGKLYAALSTAMAPPGWEGQGTNASVNGPMRGGLVEVDLATEATRVIAGGMRTPNTIGLGPEDDLFYADNQGTWFPASVLTHLQEGRFYGHYNRTNVVPKLAERFPIGGHPSVFGDLLRSQPVVYLPHNEFLNSPSKPLLIEDGPFAGQMLLGEITYGGIRRVFIEKVNGQWQGAAFRFTQGLECGVNRLRWGPDGSLYIGGIGGGGNWAWNGTQFGLQRMTPNGKTTFEFLSVSATPDGFHLRFTKPIDPDWLADPANYQSEQWGYNPTEKYGGWKTNQETLTVTAATPDADGKGVRIVVPGLKTDRCVYLRVMPESVDGDEIWSTEVFYTLNHIPTEEPIEPSTINGVPIVEAGGQDVGVGLGVLPTEDAVTLIGRSHRSLIFYSGMEPKKMANKGGLTQDDLIEVDPQQGVEVTQKTGNLLSAVQFGDFRLHMEWNTPGRSNGEYNEQTGNSGLYIQNRYELQVLATPADKPIGQYQPWEAASLYKFKTPDVNASAGPGEWQSYDVWFRAARFDEAGNKTESARITVYWNGQLIHNDVELPPGTGIGRKRGEKLHDRATSRSILTGPIILQSHFSNADGPTRYRNVWAAPLHPQAYEAGPAVDLFDGETLDGWVVRGGKSEYEVVDGEIVGTAVANSGGNTFLVTEKSYGDFELTYDINVPYKALNSGVQVRSHVDGGIGNRTGKVRGYQVEGDQNDRSYSGGIFDEGRRGWIAPLFDKPYARRAWRHGEWNTITVVARGPRIDTYVNGIPAARVMDGLSLEGHIGLQVHAIGANDSRPQVRFRNIRLRELTPREEMPTGPIRGADAR